MPYNKTCWFSGRINRIRNKFLFYWQLINCFKSFKIFQSVTAAICVIRMKSQQIILATRNLAMGFLNDMPVLYSKKISNKNFFQIRPDFPQVGLQTLPRLQISLHRSDRFPDPPSQLLCLSRTLNDEIQQRFASNLIRPNWQSCAMVWLARWRNHCSTDAEV